MQTALFLFENQEWVRHEQSVLNDCREAQLVLCFSAKHILATPGIYPLLKQKFANAEIVMGSTSGEIYQNEVKDDSLVALAIRFDATVFHTASINIADFKNSYDAASALVKLLPATDLSCIFVISDGSVVNGSELVKGLNDATENKVLITGGLAGDAADFNSTLVGLNAAPTNGMVAAVGFYGSQLIITHGSQGGWETFGPERLVTQSSGNRLFEIDSKPALDLYKKYLGPDAANLPSSALLFPLSVIIPGSTQPVVRTILSIDEDMNSMVFAGDIPMGSKVRFMKANFDKLTAAAASAAQKTIVEENRKPDLALLVSCVGRKLVLGSRIDEEVEAVHELLGNKTTIAGFYSYGEISPFNAGGACQLHNQTMTITSFYEL
jgi:hypothetical protein